MSVGDVVVLKSGGPEMTIEHVYSNVTVLAGYAKVVLFEGDKLRDQNIHLDNLREVKE